MADTPIWQQLLVATFDKLALGGIVALGGIWASRKLEQHRTHQTLAVEVAKRRVETLGECWRLVSEYEEELFAQVVRLAELMLAEMRTLGVPDVPAIVPQHAQAALSVVSRFSTVDLPEDSLARVQQLMEPRHAKSLQLGDAALAYIKAQRFWLGKDAEKAFRKHLQQMTNAFAELTPAREGRQAFAEAYRKLVEDRLDVDQIMERLVPKW